MKNMSRNHEDGVALIFALGLLTLLSVLGVAFVTNSLTAQKIAANVGSRNQARILMDSAVNRVMITLMGVFAQSPGGAGDFSFIYSAPGGYAKGDTGTTWDQLDDSKDDGSPKNDLEDSKLSVVVSAGLPKYDGSKSKASWVYVKDQGGYVTGRMAYQVLPTGLSSMSLDQVLLGVYNHDDTPGNTNFGSSTSPSWNVRIGKDITEFNIGKACGDDAPFKNEWKYDVTNAPWNSAQFPQNIYTGTGYSRENPFKAVSSFDSFFGGVMYQNVVKNSAAGMDAKQQAWFRHWFSESREASPEVFYVTGDKKTAMEEAVPYHRFNLGKISGVTDDDNDTQWYSRFKGWEKSGFKNSPDVVKALTENDSKDFLPEDKAAPKDSGLPFLRAMGDSPGSFDSIDNRRKQIAANLNDYCDSDSIPTSNLAANTWSNTNKPAYTGNEKTPYINELVLELKFNVTPQVKSSDANEVKLAITSRVTPKLLVELIDMYGGADADFGKYKVYSWLGEKIKYTIGIKEAKGTVTFSDATTADFSGATVTVLGGSPYSQDCTLSSVAATSTLAPFSAGYASSALSYSEGSSPPDDREYQLLATSIKNVLTESDKTKTISTITVTSLTLEVTKISFSLDAVCLKRDDSDGKGEYGVDFVKGPATAIESTGDSVTWDIKMNGTNAGESSNAWNYVYLSGMEVRDARQNLNFTNALTTGDFKADASDWKSKPVLQKGEGNSFDVGTMTVDASDESIFTYTGKVNSCSNPSVPFSEEDKFKTSSDPEDPSAGVPGIDFDKENVSDPAWKGNNANQHISTAFIRNAPMQSLWELGAIHRGSAWETINIKGAAVSDGGDSRRMALSDFTNTRKLADTTNGIAYQNGDAGILDQVKLTSKAYSSGKLNVNMLVENPGNFGLPAAWNKNIAKALFFNISLGQQIGDLFDKTKIGTTGTKFTNWSGVGEEPNLNTPANYLTKYAPENEKTVPKGRPDGDKNEKRFVSRADFVEGYGDPKNDRLASEILATGFGLVGGWGSLSDAQQEEIIGKTANLLTAGATLPTTIQAIIVVQTINPITAPVGTKIVRQVYKKDGTLVTDSATNSIDIDGTNQMKFKFTRFTDGDKTSYVYFDEITSELRALVTIKLVRDSDGAMRFQLYNVRFL